MILAIANQKGGVGKTTTAINLSAALAMRGHRTALIDLDPQANSTMSYVERGSLSRSVYDALTEPTCAVADILLPTPVERLWILPARIGLGFGAFAGLGDAGGDLILVVCRLIGHGAILH